MAREQLPFYTAAGMDLEPPAAAGSPTLRRLRLRYAGRCTLCGVELAKGAEALYHAETQTVRCVTCERPQSGPANAVVGSAGKSAHEEYLKRRAAREAHVKGQLGNLLGGIALTIAGESQSTRAWEQGSVGEQKLAGVLSGIDGLTVLHDRQVPASRRNIDHIVIAASGVYVVDAKNYSGLIQIRERGSLLFPDKRLYVGSRDCSRLAENMAWQTEAVSNVLSSVFPEPGRIPVRAVLCFVDGEWPLLLPPESFKGVRLEGTRSIKKLLSTPGALNAQERAGIAQVLGVALPPK